MGEVGWVRNSCLEGQNLAQAKLDLQRSHLSTALKFYQPLVSVSLQMQSPFRGFHSQPLTSFNVTTQHKVATGFLCSVLHLPGSFRLLHTVLG